MTTSDIHWNPHASRIDRLTIEMSCGRATATVDMAPGQARDLAIALSERHADWRPDCWRVEPAAGQDHTELTLYRSERGLVRVTTIALTTQESHQFANDIGQAIHLCETLAPRPSETTIERFRHRLHEFWRPHHA